MANTAFYVATNLISLADLNGVFHNRLDLMSGLLLQDFVFDEWNGVFDKRQEAPAWGRESILSHEDVSFGNIPKEWISLALDSILNDDNSYFIAERHFNLFSIYDRKDLIGPFSYSAQIQVSVIKSLEIICKSKPGCVVCQSTPHDFPTWIFCKVAEAIGIPVYVLKRSCLPWRHHISKGISTQSIIELNTKHESSGLSIRSRELLDKMTLSYADAIPSYEKKRALEHRGRFFSIRGELNYIPKLRPWKWLKPVLCSVHKYRLYREYEGLSVADAPQDGPYVVFFLHYQPERTSLPEGGKYAQQFRAILELASCLPKGWRLLVKEHPSQFRSKMNPWVRPVGFYRRLSSIEGVQLCPLSIDNFDLIDSSECVATLTGTVGFEAVARLKPVIVFGLAPYIGLPGVIPVRSLDDVKLAIHSILHRDVSVSVELIEHRLAFLERNSVTAEKVARSASFPDSGSDDKNLLSALDCFFDLLERQDLETAAW